MNTIAEIAQQLWAPAKRLHQEGLSYHAYLTELTWLLFFKTASTLSGAEHLLPTHLSWDALIQKTGRQQLEYYQKILTTLGQLNDPYLAGIYAHARTYFDRPEQLTPTVITLNAIDALPLSDLGELYERLLEKCALEDENSLHIAPRSLIDLIVILTQPQPGELIQDPLAGTASFLVAADQYVKVIGNDSSDNASLINNNFREKQSIIAIEPNLVRQRLALMNCWLHRIEHSQRIPVRWGDSLLSHLPAWPPADVILSMLVFAGEPTDELGKHDASLALLQHIYDTLKPGGRAAVILPDRILKAAGPAQQVRTTLLDTCVVHTVLRLPNGIFYPHKIPAHVLFFRRGQSHDDKTETVWFYDLRTHLPILGQYLHLTREHLIPFEKVYGDDWLGQAPRHDEGEKGRWRCFSRDFIKKQGDNLDICWLQDDEVTMADNSFTINLDEVLNETLEELEMLTEILRNE